MAYDAVIIGAGHNGLAAAVHLAAKGKRVAIVEAREDPGGAVKTREVTLPGFRHDLCAMNLSMFAGSGFSSAHKEALLAHGLAFARAENCFATVFRDWTYLGVSRTIEKTLASIAAFSSADAEAWKALLAQFGRDAPHIFALLGSPMPSVAAAKAVWKAWRARGTNWLFDTAKLLVASPRDFLDARFQHPKVKAMMAAWGLRLDFAPDVAGGALFPYLESMANQSLGMVIGQGGADTIVRAMVKAIETNGGELILGDGVSKIDLVNGAASRVTLRSGRNIEAKAVIANAHPKIVFEQLAPPEATSPAFRDALKKFRAGPGTMMIHLALDDLPVWRGGSALRDFVYIHVAPDLEMMTRVYAEASAGLPCGASLGRWAADGDRSIARAGGQTCAMGSSSRSAGRHSGRCGRDNRGSRLGHGAPTLCGPGDGHSRMLRAELEDPRARPRGLLAARSRTREPEPDRRRQSLRQPSPRPELLPASHRGLVALSDTGAQPLPLRRVDLARSWHGRGVWLYACQNAGGLRRRRLDPAPAGALRSGLGSGDGGVAPGAIRISID